MEKMLTPKFERRVSAEEYLTIMRNTKSRKNIKSSRYIAPKIGSSHYGKFEVKYKTPVLTAE